VPGFIWIGFAAAKWKTPPGKHAPDGV